MSVVAILTITVSLYMGGLVLLVTRNLSRTAAGWGEDLRVVVYLEEEASEDQPAVETDLAQLVREPAWVSQVEEVSAEEAAERFRATFPTLSELFAGWDEEPLPASIEIRVDDGAVEDEAFEAWLERLRAHPQTALVDDDRDWLLQLESVVAVVRTAGLTLGLTLLGAAIFTTASVVKLTAYLYLDEIAVMRLVGATEFFIRGPFYCEGLLQGLSGGAVALAALHLSAEALTPEQGAMWLPYLLGDFLSASQQGALVAIGGLAGLFGAVLSLRRESLRPDAAE